MEAYYRIEMEVPIKIMRNYFVQLKQRARLKQRIIRKKRQLFYKSDLSRVLSDVEHLLAEGTFKLRRGKKTILYLESPEVLSFIEKNKAILLHANAQQSPGVDSFVFHTAKTANQLFAGQLLMMSQNRDIKIFDFKKNRVLTKFPNKEKCMHIERAYDRLSPFFDFAITSFSDGYQMELLVDQGSPSDLNASKKNEMFCDLIRRYTAYFTKADKQSLSWVKPVDFFETLHKKAPSYMSARIQRLLMTSDFEQVSFPRIFLHGDLYNDNILLLHDGRVLLIDLECGAPYLFLFDVYNFIYAEAVKAHNAYFIEAYFNGAYDALLDALFSALGLMYHADKKQQYAALYLAERCLKRWVPYKKAGNEPLAFLEAIERFQRNLTDHMN